MPRVESDTAEHAAEAQFVARIGAGDAGAASALHERFSARIYFIALREMRSAADAEDVRNDTLFLVLTAIRNGRLQ